MLFRKKIGYNLRLFASGAPLSKMIDSLIISLKQQLSQLEDALLKNKIKQQDNAPQYTSISIGIDKTLLLLPMSDYEHFFLSQPNSGFTLLGFYPLITIKASGKNRFHTIKKEFNQIVKLWYRNRVEDNNGQDTHTHNPLAFLAFAFDENDPMNNEWHSLANTVLTIPQFLFKEEELSQQLIINIKLENFSYQNSISQIEQQLKIFFNQLKITPRSTHDNKASTQSTSSSSVQKKAWLSLSQKAIHNIQSGQFDKLVTSRQKTLPIPSSFSSTTLLKKLSYYYPCCSLLSYTIEDTTIIAASPERLISLHHPDIQSNAIGGTILRQKIASTTLANNKSLELPFFLKQSNEQSSKEVAEGEKLLKEHRFISQNIYQKLDPLCHVLQMPISPFLMKLHNLYHLETPISGKLMDSYDIFDCLSALHPTPAVAGLPTSRAKQWLVEHEDYHRGWYTGAFGYLDAQLNGDLSVMLRCALINKTKQNDGDSDNDNNRIHLFSGAGLVAESDPEAEWQETELKMQTILDML